MKAQKQTKADFFRNAQSNGVALMGAPWNKSIEEIEKLIEEQGERILSSDIRRDPVEGSASHMRRVKPDGSKSHLHLDKNDTIYTFKGFWLVRGEHEDGTNNTVIYA